MGNRSSLAQVSKVKYPFNNRSLSLETRVDNLLQLLTLEEKAGFLSGDTLWRLQGVKSFRIPAFRITDCGHGVTVILDKMIIMRAEPPVFLLPWDRSQPGIPN